MKSKHVVKFIGGGVWKDMKGKSWSNSVEGNPEILPERIYETEVSEEVFLNDRTDIKFMVGYGQMKITTISVSDVKPVEDQKPVEPIAPVIPVEDQKPVESVKPVSGVNGFKTII